MPLAACLFAALVARVFLYHEYLKTPLDHYTQIDSLDMKLVASQGLSFLHGHGVFTMHKLLLATSTLLAGGVFSMKSLVLAQMLLGVISSLMACDVAMRLSGSRLAGVVSGLMMGCYAPALLYELFAMKESVTLFFAMLALWAMLAAGRSSWRQSLYGVSAVALPLARPAGLLWSGVSLLWLHARLYSLKAKRQWVPMAALAVSLAAVLAFNLSVSGSLSFLDTNVAYNLQVGSIKDAVSYSIPVGAEKNGLSSFWGACLNAPGRFISLCKSYQAPDNINYYFMKSVLPALGWMPGPLLVIPLGLTGMLLCLYKWRLRSRGLVLPLFFLSMSAPICVFIVTGRYMLLLLPAFSAGAGLFISGFFAMCREDLPRRRVLKPALAFGVYALLCWQAAPSSIPLRADDFISYGLASRMKYGLCELEGASFMRALAVSPDNEPAATNFGKWLIESGRPAEAAALLCPFCEKHPENYKLLVNCSVALMASGDPARAVRLLESAKAPEEQERREKYQYLLQEAKKLSASQGEASR